MPCAALRCAPCPALPCAALPAALRSAQFLTAGVISAFVGGIQLQSCAGAGTCERVDWRGAPGQDLFVFENSIFALNVLLVWLAWLMLPLSEQKGAVGAVGDALGRLRARDREQARAAAAVPKGGKGAGAAPAGGAAAKEAAQRQGAKPARGSPPGAGEAQPPTAAALREGRDEHGAPPLLRERKSSASIGLGMAAGPGAHAAAASLPLPFGTAAAAKGRGGAEGGGAQQPAQEHWMGARPFGLGGASRAPAGEEASAPAGGGAASGSERAWPTKRLSCVRGFGGGAQGGAEAGSGGGGGGEAERASRWRLANPFVSSSGREQPAAGGSGATSQAPWLIRACCRRPVRWNAKRGGALRPLLLYDLCCFVFSSALAVWCFRTSAGWEQKAWIFWCRVLYGLLALPFFVFVIPPFDQILLHTKRTAYNQRGRCVAPLSMADRETLRKFKLGRLQPARDGAEAAAALFASAFAASGAGGGAAGKASAPGADAAATARPAVPPPSGRSAPNAFATPQQPRARGSPQAMV